MKVSKEEYEKLCKSCIWANKVHEGKVHCPFARCVKEGFGDKR